jgi:CHC2 zinc finger
MPYIDFAAVKAAHSIEDAAQRLGLKLSKSGAQFRAPCPACNSGGDRALVITPAKNLFYCFVQEKGGDQIQLVAHVRGCEVQQAAAWLQATSTTVQGTSTSTGTVSKERAEGGMQPLDYLDAEHPAVEAAGFNGEEARKLGTLLGYIGVTEARCPPKGFFPTNVVPIPKRA